VALFENYVWNMLPCPLLHVPRVLDSRNLCRLHSRMLLGKIWIGLLLNDIHMSLNSAVTLCLDISTVPDLLDGEMNWERIGHSVLMINGAILTFLVSRPSIRIRAQGWLASRSAVAHGAAAIEQ